MQVSVGLTQTFPFLGGSADGVHGNMFATACQGLRSARPLARESRAATIERAVHHAQHARVLIPMGVLILALLARFSDFGRGRPWAPTSCRLGRFGRFGCFRAGGRLRQLLGVLAVLEIWALRSLKTCLGMF